LFPYQWMRAHQRARRNLSADQHDYLMGERYRLEKQRIPNASGANQHSEVSGKSCHQPKTEAALAQQYQVSPRTVRNNNGYAVEINPIAASSSMAITAMASAPNMAFRIRLFSSPLRIVTT